MASDGIALDDDVNKIDAAVHIWSSSFSCPTLAKPLSNATILS